MFSRRNFMRFSVGSVASMALRPFGLLPGLAQTGSADYRALVCLFLFGGNDSNNMIVPQDDTRYKQYLAARGSLGLQGSSLTGQVFAKSGKVPYAFNAALPEVATLFSNGELAVVANVGTLVKPVTRAQYRNASAPLPRNLFSHLDQQTEWQTAIGNGNGATGWAGRAADLVSSQNSSIFPTFFSVNGSVPMGIGVNTQEVALNPQGSLDIQGFDTSEPSQSRLAAFKNLLTLNTGITLAQASNAVLRDSIEDAKLLDKALSLAGLRTPFPDTPLGQQLQQIAQVIQVRDTLGMRRQIFFCSLSGFDTHDQQLSTQYDLLVQVSQALQSFQLAMQELGTQNDVTTFTESDFNRTFQPTSGNGSDHAWGSHQLVMGGAVAGTDIYGTFPTLDLGGPDDADARGRWIPTTSLEQYGATLCSWFGISDANLSKVFPNLGNFATKKLSFLG